MAITRGSLIKVGRNWQWKYRLDGMVRWESLKVASKREAEIVRQERMAIYHSDRAHFDKDDKNPPIADLMANYLEWAPSHLRPKTIEGAQWAVALFKRLSGVKTFGIVAPRHIERFTKRMAEEGRSNVSINNSLRAMRSFVNRANKNQWYSGENPFIDFDKLPEEKKKPLWLSGTEIKTILKHAQAHSSNAYLVFGLGIYAGLRKGEIDAARWSWINWEQKFVQVQGDEFFTIKNKSERTIPLKSELAAILKRYQQPEGYIVAPGNQPKNYRYRFDIRKGFDAVAKAAELEWVTPHVLRHTFASQLVSNGVNLYKVGQWLGHSDPTTTAIYAHLLPHDDDIEAF
jgi:integrase